VVVVVVDVGGASADGLLFVTRGFRLSSKTWMATIKAEALSGLDDESEGSVNLQPVSGQYPRLPISL